MTKKELEAENLLLTQQLELIGSEFKELSEELRRSIRYISLCEQDAAEPYQMPMSDTIDYHARPQAKDALQRAEGEWLKKVQEPPRGEGQLDIQKYIRQGLTWQSCDRKDFGQPLPYVRDSFSWCGAFAAWCYITLKRDIRKKIMPSCSRLSSNWGRSGRNRTGGPIQAGDILTVWTTQRGDQRNAYGQHIVLACGPANDQGMIDTVEGNAKGSGPEGQYYEGVIKRQRSLEDVARVYRPFEEDFEHE